MGAPISVADHIEAILEGLPEEYNNFVVSVTSRSEPYSVDEIEALLAQEERIENFKKDTNTTVTMSVNMAQKSNKGFQGNPRGNYQGSGNFQG